MDCTVYHLNGYITLDGVNCTHMEVVRLLQPVANCGEVVATLLQGCSKVRLQ